MALALREDGHQHIGARDVVAARALNVDDGALDHPLEAGGRLGVVAVRGSQCRQIGVDIEGQRRFQRRQIDIAGRHHTGRVRVIDQGEQEMLQGGVFVPALVRIVNGPVQGFFEMA